MYQEIDIKKLRPSGLNYRKSMDKQALEELTASVRAKGVLQPVLVRPLGGKGKAKGKGKANGQTHEIVAGHRRFTAARAAGLKVLPAIVRDLDDETALEIQVIENSQREDPNPMDEAHGFKRLIKMGKHTPETLAQKIDHSKRYVLERLRLLDLPKAAREKVAAGDLPLGSALLITRIKGEKEQGEFLDHVLHGEYGNGMTIKDARQLLRQDYILDLSSAPFSTSGCNACPLRSINQIDLFPELKDSDECTDRDCYRKKTIEFYEEMLAEKANEGFKIVRTAQKVRSNQKISATTDSWDEVKPKRYKSACTKCLDNHAWYFYEEYGRIHFGEICLDKKCLNKMNAPKGKAGEAHGVSSMSHQDAALEKMRRAERASKCRDRWLRRKLAPRVACSGTLQRRLALRAIMHDTYHCRGAVVKLLTDEKLPLGRFEKQGEVYIGDEYELALLVPELLLDRAIRAALVASIEHLHGEDVLLKMMDEAGLDPERDFELDREYVTSQSFRTKGDLQALARELGIDGASTLPKDALIDKILAGPILGRMPGELKAAFSPEWQCRVCGAEEKEKCVCHYAPCPSCGDDPEICGCKP